MLLYETLFNKATINDDTEGEYVDLLSDSLKEYNTDSQEWASVFQGARRAVVSKYYVARPDLISLAFFKDDCYADLICKLNGISNPFELNENMILLIPDRYKLESLKAEINPSESEMISSTSSSSSTTSSSSSTTSSSSSDITNIKKTNQKLKNERRSPAEATVEDSNYTVNYDLGLVFY
jgi:hypothetical protein